MSNIFITLKTSTLLFIMFAFLFQGKTMSQVLDHNSESHFFNVQGNLNNSKDALRYGKFSWQHCTSRKWVPVNLKIFGAIGLPYFLPPMKEHATHNYPNLKTPNSPHTSQVVEKRGKNNKLVQKNPSIKWTLSMNCTS